MIFIGLVIIFAFGYSLGYLFGAASVYEWMFKTMRVKQ